MTSEQIARLAELDEIIANALAEKKKINPFVDLRGYSNKKFGEEWSESYICSQVPNLSIHRGVGYDLYSSKLGNIEVKSTRLPTKKWTMNQVHVYDCDYLLFVKYNTETAEVDIYLIPASEIKSKLGGTVQHERNISFEEASCISISQTVARERVLNEYYKIESWEVLNELC